MGVERRESVNHSQMVEQKPTQRMFSFQAPFPGRLLVSIYQPDHAGFLSWCKSWIFLIEILQFRLLVFLTYTTMLMFNWHWVCYIFIPVVLNLRVWCELAFIPVFSFMVVWYLFPDVHTCALFWSRLLPEFKVPILIGVDRRALSPLSDI